MIHPYAVAGFLLAILPLIATPGASLALLMRHVADGGGRQALPVILGTVSGLYVHAGLAIAGLSAVVMHSSQAFTALRLAGAAYLIGLGLWTWRSATAGRSERRPAVVRRHRLWGGDSVFAQALLGNVLNPKAAAVFLTLVPQFIVPGRPLAGQILTLATAQGLLVTLWLLGWAIVVGRAARVVKSPGFRRVTGRLTGVILLGLGLRSAVG